MHTSAPQVCAVLQQPVKTAAASIRQCCQQLLAPHLKTTSGLSTLLMALLVGTTATGSL
jgi:hypothetical protein